MFGEWQILLVGNGQGTQVSKWSLLARKSPHAVMRVTVINWELLSGLCQWVWIKLAFLMPDCSVRTTDRYIVTWICLILQKQENSFPVDSTTGGLSKGEITNHLQQIKGATPTVPSGYLGLPPLVSFWCWSSVSVASAFSSAFPCVQLRLGELSYERDFQLGGS